MGKGQRNIKIPTLAGKSDGGKARPKKRGTRGTSILYASYRAYQMAGSDVTLANSMPLPSLSLSLSSSVTRCFQAYSPFAPSALVPSTVLFTSITDAKGTGGPDGPGNRRFLF